MQSTRRSTTALQIVAILVLAAGVVVACGAQGKGSDDAATTEGTEVFDTSVVHEFEMSFDDEDYEAMLATFSDTGEKEWIEVTVTIDGTTYEQAGARLKGNSSLAGLGGGFGPGRGGGSDSQGDDTEAAEDLPWLIRLNKFVDGQEHQGYEDFVVRSNGSETSLNEAVALDLLAEAGLASQEAVAASFSVNGSDPTLRLVIEHPDDDEWYEQAFEADGALYKAESSGDWSYRGDDAADYEEVFDQEGGSDIADLTPLIDFLEFINESDDATFAAELSERLDVESFATYLAMMDLLGNFDDIDGPGNNAYLWWDAESEQFTVVPWDLNLAFGGGGGFGGPGGGGGFPGGGERPGGFDPPDDVELPDDIDPDDLPEDFQPPADGDAPEGFEPPSDVNPGAGRPGGGGRGGGFGGSNILVERFHDNDEFEALYQQALEDLEAELFESGTADEILQARTDALTSNATDLVDEETINSESTQVANSF